MKIEIYAEYINNIETIIMSLENIYRNSILEKFVQNPQALAGCFIRGEYYYSRSADVSVNSLKNFLVLLKSVSYDKQRIIMNNLWQRIDNVRRYEKEDDLPF